MAVTAHTQALPRLVADRCAEFAAADAGERLAAIVRIRMLDFAANVVGGAGTPSALAIAEYSRRFPGEIPMPGGHLCSAEGASLMLGATAHVLEWDDTHQPSSTHPGAVIFAAALTTAAEVNANFAELVVAVVTGYEVMCAIGEAAGPLEQYSRGFHPTGTCGVFGATAAAAMLLGLPADRFAASIGLAASVASGSMAFLEGGGGSKLLNAGHAASAGVTVARLAEVGYEGPVESLSGPNGFLVGHSTNPSIEAVERVFGRNRTALEETSIKAHGCCRYEQGPIDALLALRREHNLAIGEINAVKVGMLEAGWNIVAAPLAAKRRPASVVESQFSMPFGAALALVGGRAAPQDHDIANLADARIQRVMDLVECYRDPELDARFPRQWPAAVQISMNDGSRFEAEVDHPKGDPENPLSDDEVLAKLESVAPAGQASEARSLGALILGRDAQPLQPVEVLKRLASLTSVRRDAALERTVA